MKARQALRDKADKGLLITFNWSTAVLGDRRLRINGQHSSNMLCELNGAFPSGLKVHHDEYKVENEGDVVLLYRQLDERKSGRSVGDIAWAYQGVVPELKAVPKGTAKLAVEGIAWYQRRICTAGDNGAVTAVSRLVGCDTRHFGRHGTSAILFLVGQGRRTSWPTSGQAQDREMRSGQWRENKPTTNLGEVCRT